MTVLGVSLRSCKCIGPDKDSHCWVKRLLARAGCKMHAAITLSLVEVRMIFKRPEFKKQKTDSKSQTSTIGAF